MANFYLANESLLLIHASPYCALNNTDILNKQHGYYLQTAPSPCYFYIRKQAIKTLVYSETFIHRILRTNRRLRTYPCSSQP
jgi:hypothetical protein